MIIFFFLLVVFALIHFIYEGIIAPSLRLSLRYHLFALRDDLRRLKFEQGEALTDDVFRSLQSIINNSVTLLHRVNPEVILRTEMAIENDKNLSRVIRQRIALIEECPIEKVHLIEQRTHQIIKYAFLINNGALLIYIIPIFLLVFSANRITNFIKEAVSLPENELNRITPINP